jgi:CheY-like chemotaxis protein
MALINDILDFSKIEAGKLELEDIEFEVVDCVRGVAQMLATAARRKGLALRLDVGDGVPGRVRGDPLRLRQVLVNLAANAVKFSESGAVVMGVAAVEPNRLRFTVADTGIGIDPTVRDSLLQPFSQADSSTTRRFGGTGLGLAICAQLVELMGGTLDFDSRIGEGSTFWFEVPLPTATHVGDGPARGARVLLADSSRTHQLVGAAVLARLGCLVDVATNGAEAVDAVRRTRYDAVFMECEMPVMDGYEATGLIRRLESGGSHTLIVAVTASALAGERDKCLAAGMDDCVSKPLDQAILAGLLRRCWASA